MKRTLAFFFLWLVVIHLFAWLAFNRLYLTEPDKAQFLTDSSFPKPPPLDFLKMHARWDSDWYIETAINGYSYSLEEKTQSNVVFFPLYPLTIKILGNGIKAGFPQLGLYQSYVLAGTTVSALALLIAIIFLFKLLSLDFNQKISSRTIINLLIFPTAFFFVAVYSESLFLALSVLTFFFARKRRWVLASVFGALASLTKPIGILLLVPLVVEFIGQRRKKITEGNFLLSASFLLMPAAVGLFAWYLKKQFNDPLAFIHAQEAFGRTSPLKLFSNPLILIDSLYSQITFAFSFTRASLTNILFEIFFTFWGLILSLYLLRIRLSYGIYCLMVILLSASSGVLVSQGRYLAVLFPLFILLSCWGENEIFRNIYRFSSILLLGLNIVLFVNGYWAG